MKDYNKFDPIHLEEFKRDLELELTTINKVLDKKRKTITIGEDTEQQTKRICRNIQPPLQRASKSAKLASFSVLKCDNNHGYYVSKNDQKNQRQMAQDGGTVLKVKQPEQVNI